MREKCERYKRELKERHERGRRKGEERDKGEMRVR